MSDMSETLLELREPDDAFRRIEDWLRTRGFFAPGGEELIADLYLGYALSQSIRRGASSSPPEPCPELPLAACRLRSVERLVTKCHKGLQVGAWEQTWTAAEYRAAVDEVRDAIARGDVYQVNLVQHVSAPFSGRDALYPASPQPGRRGARARCVWADERERR